MAKSHQSSVQDQMADVTECSICTEIYTNPKILPCVHTFCLQCLEKYGSEKKKGDKMACPICRSEFLIPDGGLCRLPNNFFISKMMEIRKLSETSTNEALCGTCPDEERLKAKMFCFQCEQNLCERCRIAHSKMKLCQNHQVVEIGNKLKLQEVNFRSSYCDQHPGELVKMYCEDDKATICILCFAESHQSHKCLSVTKASEEFSTAIKTDLKTVLERLPEFQTARAQFEKMEKDFLAHIVVVEKQIFDEAARLKALIDSHANILTQKLTAFKDERLTEIKSIKEDADRFKVTIESYARYSEELLSKGAPGDICQEADQLTNRARHLVSMTESGFSVDFNCDGVTFKTLNLEDILRMKNVDNVIGDVQEDSMSDHLALPATHGTVEEEPERRKKRISEALHLKSHQLDLIKREEFQKKLKQEIPDIEFEIKQTKVNLCGMPDVVKKAKLFIKVTGTIQDSFEISESMSKVFGKDEAKPYLMERLIKKDISASWKCSDRSVVVYALDEQKLKELVEVLKHEVVEKSLQLSALDLCENLDQSQEWKDFIECLCKEDKLLEVLVNESVLVVAGMKSSFEKNKRRIENFLAKNNSLYYPYGLLFKSHITYHWQ